MCPRLMWISSQGTAISILDHSATTPSITIYRVITDLESQRRPEHFFISLKSQEKLVNLKKKTDYHEIRKVIILLRLSFHAPVKTSCKMLKIVNEICAQVK